MSVHGEERIEGYIYLDFYHPPTVWNIARGVFHTPGCLPDSESSLLLSVSMATMLSNNSTSRLIGELHLDDVRANYYPANVSRLTGFFIFDEIESMSQLWGNNSWGGHFDDQYITDVGVDSRKSSRVDSNWILEIFDVNGGLQPSWEVAAHKYWKGEAHPGKKPVWERIVEGALTIWSMSSKKAALKEIEALWPESLSLLANSINCASYGSFDGEVFPVYVYEEDSIAIDYILRMTDSKDGLFIANLSKFVRDNPDKCASIKYNGSFTLPDLSGFKSVFKPDEEGSLSLLVEHFLNS